MKQIHHIKLLRRTKADIKAKTPQVKLREVTGEFHDANKWFGSYYKATITAVTVSGDRAEPVETIVGYLEAEDAKTTYRGAASFARWWVREHDMYDGQVVVATNIAEFTKVNPEVPEGATVN